jgi:hypothetical protein
MGRHDLLIGGQRRASKGLGAGVARGSKILLHGTQMSVLKRPETDTRGAKVAAQAISALPKSRLV